MDNLTGKALDWLRKRLGAVIAFFGFLLLALLTFGDIGEIATVEYWENVVENLSSIGFLSIGLTAVQVTTKQGLAEQALRNGLNSELTTKKFEEHRQAISDCNHKQKYIGYFLNEYNTRKTRERKRAFIIKNNYRSETEFLKNAPKKLKKSYAKICNYVTVSRITWATTAVEYDEHGNIRTLAEHRLARTIKATIMGAFTMVGVALMARGLFFDGTNTSWGEKTITFFAYVFVIIFFSLPAIAREREKGAIGVPNDLAELNEIWQEFKEWDVPQWVIDEVGLEREKQREVLVDEKGKETVNVGTDLQSEPPQG